VHPTTAPPAPICGMATRSYQPGLHRAGRRGGLDACRYYYLPGCEAMDEDCGSQRVLV